MQTFPSSPSLTWLSTFTTPETHRTYGNMYNIITSGPNTAYVLYTVGTPTKYDLDRRFVQHSSPEPATGNNITTC